MRGSVHIPLSPIPTSPTRRSCARASRSGRWCSSNKDASAEQDAGANDLNQLGPEIIVEGDDTHRGHADDEAIALDRVLEVEERVAAIVEDDVAGPRRTGFRRELGEDVGLRI